MAKSNARTMKNKVVLSTVAQLVSQIGVAGLAIVILKILTKNLGVHDYGIYAIVIAFVTTFSLFTDLGLNAITSREIAKFPERAQDIIGDNMMLRLTLGVVVIPIIYGLGFIFYPHAAQQLRIGILFFSVDLLFDAVRSVSLAYFSAKVQSHIPAIVSAIDQVLFLLFVVITVTMGYGILGIIGAYLLADFVAAVISFVLVRRQLAIRLQFRFHEWPIIARLSAPLGIIQLVNVFYLKADSILLSVMRSPAEVGFYAVAYSIINTATTLPSYLMASLIPSIVHSSKEELQDITQRAFDILFVVSVLIATVGILMRRDIIVVLSGKAFLPAALPLAILLAGTIFSALNAVFGFIAVALDRYRKLVFISIGNAVLNILINLFFIPRFGIKGAASATLITELVSFVATYIVFKNTTHITISIKYCWKACVAALCIIFIGHFLVAKDQFNIGIVVVFGIILSMSYIIILALLRGLPSDLVNLATSVFKLRRKKV